MPTARWCDTNDVKEHMGDAENAKGYTDANFAEKIKAAEDYLSPYFAFAVSSGTVAGWTQKTLTPPAITRLTAMMAAINMLTSYGGQSIQDEPTKAASLWKLISDAIEGIQDGTYQLVDPSGGGAVTILPESTTRFKTPTLSMGNDGDGSEGTLDNF